MPLAGGQSVQFCQLHILESLSNRHQQLFETQHKPISFASASAQAAAGQQESQIQNLPHRRRTNSPHQQFALENEPEEEEEEEEDQLPLPLNPKV